MCVCVCVCVCARARVCVCCSSMMMMMIVRTVQMTQCAGIVTNSMPVSFRMASILLQLNGDGKDLSHSASWTPMTDNVPTDPANDTDSTLYPV